MSRSKDSIFYNRHERQIIRNQTEARMKKTRAGSVHWEKPEDESDVEELIYSDPDTHTVNNTSTKLHLVDPQTFHTMRHEQLS